MKNYVQKGETITVTSPDDFSSGDIIVVGSILGVAAADVLTGAEVEIATEGVFDLPKAAGSISQGQKLYYASGTADLTTTPGTDSKPLAGVAIAGAASDAATVRCKLGVHGILGPSA